MITSARSYRPPGGAWRQLHTARVGNDIYQAPLPGLGDYALVHLSRANGPAPRAAAGTSPLVWVLGGGVSTPAAAVLAVRRRRSRESDPEGGGPEGQEVKIW